MEKFFVILKDNDRSVVFIEEKLSDELDYFDSAYVLNQNGRDINVFAISNEIFKNIDDAYKDFYDKYPSYRLDPYLSQLLKK